jgi:hypothetical protein
LRTCITRLFVVLCGWVLVPNQQQNNQHKKGSVVVKKAHKRKKQVRHYRSKKSTPKRAKKTFVYSGDIPSIHNQPDDVMVVLTRKDRKRAKDRNRQLLKKTGKFLRGDTLDRVVAEIERESKKSPPSSIKKRAFHEDHNKGQIDTELMGEISDPESVGMNGPEEAVAPIPECDCEGDETCDVCLAEADVAALRPNEIKAVLPAGIKKPIGVRQFVVTVPTTVAERLDQAVG